jgi:peptidoglycan/LPS O-acetylase OafA/YrhL
MVHFLDNPITSIGSGRPFWTIAIEWWLYIWFGFFVLAILNQNKIRIHYLVIFILLSILPFYNAIGGRGGGLTITWVLGCFAYLLYGHYTKLIIPKFVKVMLLFGIFIIVILRLMITKEAYDTSLSFFLAIFLVIFLDLSRQVRISQSFVRVSRFIASYSFSLYLFHYTILEGFVLTSLSIDPYINFIFSFIFSNVLAYLLAKITEMRHREFRAFLKSRLSNG